MIIHDLCIHAQLSYSYAGVVFYITDEGGKAVVTNMTMKETKPFVECIEPICCLSKQAAQSLMDDLWKAGLRPTEGEGSAGSLAATQAHLGDMRKIVAVKLGVTL